MSDLEPTAQLDVAEGPSAERDGDRRVRLALVTVGLAAGVALLVVGAVVLSRPSSSKPSSATQNWVPVTDSAARFTASLPAQPEDEAHADTLDSIKVMTHVATAKIPNTDRGFVLIGAVDLSYSLPQAAIRQNLRSAIFGFAATSGLTLNKEQESTFRSYQAWSGSLSLPDGTPFTALAFAYSPRRLYILFAPTGYAEALEGSFQPTA